MVGNLLVRSYFNHRSNKSTYVVAIYSLNLQLRYLTPLLRFISDNK